MKVALPKKKTSRQRGEPSQLPTGDAVGWLVGVFTFWLLLN